MSPRIQSILKTTNYAKYTTFTMFKEMYYHKIDESWLCNIALFLYHSIQIVCVKHVYDYAITHNL